MATFGVPKTAKERGKIAPAKLAHLFFQTSRYDEMVAWYKTVLEAEAVYASDANMFLTYDGEHHRIAIQHAPGLADRPKGTSGLGHYAFTYETLDELFATYERLDGLGIHPFWCINHGTTLSMYFFDPDGNQVELQIDIFETLEETNNWFEQSDFEVNFIGVKFDPPELIARYRNGEDRASLLARPVIDASEVMDQLPDAFKEG
jgi:catechol-2,3-dioxygenase